MSIFPKIEEADPILGRIIKVAPPLKFVSTQLVFHDLMSCILEQQIHYRSTKKIFQKMLDSAGIEVLTPENFGDLEEKGFAKVTLSIGKLETAHRVLEYWQTNTLDWQQMSNQEVVERLSGIKGIGKWTIDMILLFTLERPNVFPKDDFHLKQIMAELYGLNANVKLEKQMSEIAELWGDHKSLAVLYLLGWKEFNKKLKK